MTTRRVYWSAGVVAILAIVAIVGTALAQVVKQGSSGAATHQGVANRTQGDEKRCKASDMIGRKVRGLKAMTRSAQSMMWCWDKTDTSSMWPSSAASWGWATSCLPCR